MKRRRVEEMRELRNARRKAAEVTKPQRTSFVVKLSVVVVVGAVAVSFLSSYLKGEGGGGSFDWLL